eukprot:scaffold41335_cov221-Amphora_coffeaeformis.AAC.3
MARGVLPCMLHGKSWGQTKLSQKETRDGFTEMGGGSNEDGLYLDCLWSSLYFFDFYSNIQRGWHDHTSIGRNGVWYCSSRVWYVVWYGIVPYLTIIPWPLYRMEQIDDVTKSPPTNDYGT